MERTKSQEHLKVEAEANAALRYLRAAQDEGVSEEDFVFNVYQAQQALLRAATFLGEMRVKASLTLGV